MPKQISMVSSRKDTYKEGFLANQLVEAQINPSLSPKMKAELIDVLYLYNNAFASDNEPLGPMKGHDFDITLNIVRPYPLVLVDQLIQPVPELEKPWKNISNN
ncbi:hypothetical protein O181_063800 [Austropuccinia psidii MF-1]|uniref:Uncharacterized protein n=1 Tax=Austropuccinia psidii MF-1 TaxID=1389203 RepID=A0A9Q3EJE5_9BASI|nr:hypothetical protein [Austropuccinia psidii MF-1]